MRSRYSTGPASKLSACPAANRQALFLFLFRIPVEQLFQFPVEVRSPLYESLFHGVLLVWPYRYSKP